MSSHLPIFKSALDLCVYVEIMVKSFEKYHKYTLGHDMREFAKEMLFMINRVNLSKNRVEMITKLRDKCEDMKMLLLLAKELKAYKNFNQFEHSSKLSVNVCKQAQAWLRAQEKGENF
ncbi:MAG: four helix bundle protein [Candidatus Woesearchaeota archaeon]|nr:four helix bundle protein [Candidatus Woesearchaeota archaeon]